VRQLPEFISDVLAADFAPLSLSVTETFENFATLYTAEEFKHYHGNLVFRRVNNPPIERLPFWILYWEASRNDDVMY